MLKKMGDPAADKGTLTSMNSRLIGLIVDCGVELVILDDFHHLIDSETNRILSSVSDWLKVLIKETNIPYMVIGVENTIEMILDTNKQLSRLFASRLDLEPFKWDPANQATIQEFDRFIHYVEQARLPLDKSLSRLELLYRIHYATNGVMSNMMNLLNLAAVFASDRGREKISPDQLALAFDKRLAEHVENKINPFTQDWDIRFTSPVS
jgi:hypothetical protein